MILDPSATVALYCSHCGKLHLHDVSRFSMKKNSSRKLICSCGYQQGMLSSAAQQYLLRIPCEICQTDHIICLDSKNFWRTPMEKIYCHRENLEMGMYGDRQVIENMLTGYKHEFNRLLDELGAEEFIEDPQIMLEVLNRVHDIAEKGEALCRCGSVHIEAQILPDGIALECVKCGGTKIIPASNEQDLVRVERLETIELIPPRHSHRKH